MTNFKKLLYLLLPFQLLFSQNTPHSISLTEAVEWSLIHNEDIAKADLELQKAYKEKWKVLSTGFPQLKANAGYNYNLQLPVSLVPAQIFGGPEGEFAELQFGTKQITTASARLDQLVFSGEYIVGVQGIKHFISLYERGIEKTELEVKRATVSAYVNAISSLELIKILEQNRNILVKNLYETQKLYETGFVEEEDVQQLQLTLTSLESQINYANKNKEISFKFLTIILGMEMDTELVITDSLESLAVQNLNADYTNADTSNNIDLRMTEAEITGNELLVKVEKAKNLPIINSFITAGYTGNSDSFTFLDSSQRWFGSSMAGLQVSIPIFSSHKNKVSIQKAKLALEQAKIDLQKKTKSIDLEFQKALNDYNYSVSQYYNSKSNLDLASTIENKNNIKFFEGLSSSFELRQAQFQLYKSQQDYISALGNVILKKNNLDILLNKNKENEN